MKKVILVFGIIVVLVLSTHLAFAQGKYPTRAVEIVSPNAAGGGLILHFNFLRPDSRRFWDSLWSSTINL